MRLNRETIDALNTAGEALRALGLGAVRGPLDFDWPCPRCGVIGCDHDDGLPEYQGAFLTEGRH